MKKYILIVTIFAFLISACGSTTTPSEPPIDPATDRKLAEQTIRDFYAAVLEQRYVEAYQFLSSEHRNGSTVDSLLSNVQYHLVDLKIVSIEPFEGAVETDRCKRFYVVLEQKITEEGVQRDRVIEEWVAVVKEEQDWRLNPSYYGLNKDACNNIE